MLPVRTPVVIAHIAAWMLFLSLPILFVNGQAGLSGIASLLSSPYTWLFFITYISIFYLNTWVLLPRLYQKKKFFLYAVTLFAILVAIWFLKPFDRLISSRNIPGMMMEPRPTPPPAHSRKLPPDKPPRPPDESRQAPHVDVVSIFIYIVIIAISMALYARQRLRLTEQRALQAEADKANAELSFLKAQINPHFLFNTLNNIYSLATAKSEHTAESIMKLSNIMRYVTDDVMEEYVPLENEVAFISDYIDLQQLRLGDRMQVDFLVAGKITGKKIAPLILMTFVENVFKYGVSSHEPAPINIQITAEDDKIIFLCTNRLYETKRQAESTGIGIANTRKRLEHLYPDKHELLINSGNSMYTVQLTLQV
jgi:hypothetical protein